MKLKDFVWGRQLIASLQRCSPGEVAKQTGINRMTLSGYINKPEALDHARFDLLLKLLTHFGITDVPEPENDGK